MGEISKNIYFHPDVGENMDGNLQNVRQDANETFHAGKKNKTNRV